MSSSVYRHGFIYILSLVVTRVLSFILLPLYISSLSPTDFGYLDIILLFINFANITFALEISQGLTRFYPSELDIQAKNSLFMTVFWFSLLCFFAMALILYYYSSSVSFLLFQNRSSEQYLNIGLVYMFLNAATSVVLNYFRLEMKSLLYACLIITISFVTFCSTAILIYFFNYGLLGALLGMSIGSGVGLLGGLYHIRSVFSFSFDFLKFKQMIFFSFPLVFSSLSVFINSYVDRIMISRMLSGSELGLYGVSFRFASISCLVFASFNYAITPYIYKYFGTLNFAEKLSDSFRIVTGFSLIIFIFSNIIFPYFLYASDSGVYFKATSIFDYLYFSLLISQMYIFAPGIDIAKKTYLIFIVNSVGALVNLSFNYFLISLYGLQGAAIATLLGSISVFICYIYFSQKFYHVPYPWKKLAVSVFFILFLHAVAIIYNFYDVFNMGSQLVLLSISVAIVYYAGLITTSDLVNIRQSFAN